MDLSTISSTFAGKNVFITGGTGFVGRVLIEKLLRSCPDIGKIYLLLREKRGKSLEERLKQLHELRLFESVNKLYPSAFNDKVLAVSGNMMELRMGLSDDDYKMLVNNVTIIIHSAATVQFNQPLRSAILMIIRGAREMCNLALECKHLECYQHVSSTYTNTHESNIYEQLYPAPADWRKCITIAENMPQHQLQIIMKHFLDRHCNTYTFSKAVAEHVTHDMLYGRVPNIVLRPSISAWKEPIKGWIDNFNGPATLVYLSGMGLQRINYVDFDVEFDYIPVDIVVKAMIVSIWHKLIKPDLKTEIYHASNTDNKFCNKYFSSVIGTITKYGTDKMLWYPAIETTTSFMYFYVCVILCQVIPSVLGDSLLKLFTGKTRLLKIQRLLYTTQLHLAPFTHNTWNFDHSKLFALNDQLLESDYQDFNFLLNDHNWQTNVLDITTTFKLQMLKETTNKKKLYRKLIFFGVIYWSLKLIAYYYILTFLYNSLLFHFINL